MRFVSLSEGQMYPAASPSGDQGELLDTGWDVLWPGPARVYLSEGDLRDIVCADGFLELPLVAEALSLRGWTSAAALAEVTGALERELSQLGGELAELRAEADGLLLALQRVAPDAVPPSEDLLVAAGGQRVAVGVTNNDEGFGV